MHIALTHPYCWPQVRRGSERMLNDLAHYLADRGHRVTVVTTAVGPVATFDHPNIELIALPQRLTGARSRWLNAGHAFAFQCWRVLRDLDADAVHCLHYHDAFGAALALGRRSRSRLVLQYNGIPVRRAFRTMPHDLAMLGHALNRASATVVLSRFAADSLARDFGRAGTWIPSPTDTTPYRAQPKRPAERPAVLFVGDADEPRKGALTLARAFPKIRAALPDAELRFSGRMSDATRSALLSAMPAELHGAVHVLGLGAVAELPAVYASATVSVLPSVWEAFGNVLVEALASGTPVVGCRHGGIQDIITDRRIGAMFDPGPVSGHSDNVEGLAAAVIAAARLAADPQTERLCRHHAEAFSWATLGPKYEALYA